MRQLQIGDTVIRSYGLDMTNLYKIDRVSNSRAYSGEQGFQREYKDDGRIVEYPRNKSQWNRPYYQFGTKELMNKYSDQFKRKQLLHFAMDIKFDKLSTEQLEKIKAIVEGK